MHPKYWKSGRKQVFYSPTDGEDSGGGGALDVHSAGDKLAALMGDDDGDSVSSADAAPAADAGADDAAADDADGDQVEGEGEQQAGEQDADAITVEIDGKQVALTREQIAEAYKAGQKQQDLSRESAQVAEQLKAAETEKAQARAERETYAQQLQQVLAANQLHAQQDGEWTPDRVMEDPVGHQLAVLAANQRAQQNQLAQAELHRIGQLHQQEQAQETQEYFARQKAELVKANPDWKDEAKFKAGLEALEPFMVERGFTPGEGRHLFDARFIGVIQDAKKYRDLTARAKETAQKVATVPPKVAAPGRQPIAPTDGRTVAMKRLKASGSVNDAASLLAGL